MSPDAVHVRLNRLTLMLNRIPGPFFLAETLRATLTTKLTLGGWMFERDFAVAHDARADFLVMGLAVVLARPGARGDAETLALLGRLAQNREVDGIVLLTRDAGLALPVELHGKPIRRVLIEGSW